MIRTNVVDLTVIPAAAYRQKLPTGGAGIVILRSDVKQPGIASISKTSGKAIPSANTPAESYPAEAFQEAIALTAGLPYHRQGSVRYVSRKLKEEQDKPAPELEEYEAVVDSREYAAVVERFTDKNGKLSYELLNREFIKFAHSSSKVREMLEAHRSVEAIRLYIAGAKFRSITGNDKLTDAQVLKIAELLDEASPKGVFRDLNKELRAKLKAAKQK